MPKKAQNKSRFLVIVIIALVVLGLIVFGIISAINQSSIPEFNDGSELSVISLTSSSDESKEWSYAIENDTIAKITDKNTSDSEDGNGIEHHFIVSGLKPGTTTITFRYGSFSTGKTEEEHKYKIEVNSKLETRITEQ